jgi:hypothetical protein
VLGHSAQGLHSFVLLLCEFAAHVAPAFETGGQTGGVGAARKDECRARIAREDQAASFCSVTKNFIGDGHDIADARISGAFHSVGDEVLVGGLSRQRDAAVRYAHLPTVGDIIGCPFPPRRVMTTEGNRMHGAALHLVPALARRGGEIRQSEETSRASSDVNVMCLAGAAAIVVDVAAVDLDFGTKRPNPILAVEYLDICKFDGCARSCVDTGRVAASRF